MNILLKLKLLEMYDKMLKSLDEGSDKDDRVKRMEKFLNDPVPFQTQDTEICLSLSSSSDVSDSVLLNTPDDVKQKIQEENNSLPISKPKRQPSKTPIKKIKSLNCTKVKGSTENVDTIKIDEYDSINLCEFTEEDKKIIKLIEEDCLKNIENEVQNIKNIEENQNEQVVNKKEEKINQNQKRKHDSSFKWKSRESNYSKKTVTSTGCSPMKTMKKQINKKEFKCKQLNVCTEINKSKSKSLQDKISNLVDLAKKSKPVVVLNRLDLSSYDNVNKSKSKSLQDKISNCADLAKKSKPVVLLNRLDLSSYENVNKSKSKSLQDKISNFVDLVKKSKPVVVLSRLDLSLETKTGNISPDKLDLLVQCMEDHDQEDLYSRCTEMLQNPIIEEQSQSVSDTDNISKFIADAQVHRCSLPVKILPENEKIILESHSSKKVKENICIIEEIANSAESCKVTERNVGKIKEKNSNESEDVISATPDSKKELGSSERSSLRSATKRNSNENPQTERKTSPKRRRISRRSKKEKTDDPKDQNALKEQSKSKVALNEEHDNEEILSKDKTSTKNGNEDNTDHQNFNHKSRLLDGYHSLPLQSNSHTPVVFNETVTPCLKKIEEFYKEIIPLSQKFTNETESFTNILSNSKECKATENVETQTDNIKCPKCSCIIAFNSKDKTKSFENTTVVGFKQLNDIDNISKHFSEGNDSQKIWSNSNNTKQANSNSADIILLNTSEKSSKSELLKTKKVNRQLTYSGESSNSQRRKFKRIRSPTPDSDLESVKSKKSNRNYSKLLYKDIDIFFDSDSSEKNHDLSLGSQTNDKYQKKLCSKTINSMNKANNLISNPEDTSFSCISFLEQEYKNVQFDISKENQPVEKQNFDSALNTVIDDLLSGINVSDFETDNFEPDNKKKSPLNYPPDSGNKNNAVQEKDLETVSLSARNTEDKVLNKKLENFVSDDIVVVEDYLDSDKDISEEDNIVETTPQKTTERGNFEFAEELPVSILDIIDPPATVTENLEWFGIAPPPPLEFQDTEKVEEPKSVILNVSSISPDIFALNPLDKGFFANNAFLSGNSTKQTIKKSLQTIVRKEFAEFDIIPNSTTPEKEVRNQENNKTIIPSNPESKICQHVKRNLNPIVLAQKEKFSPLQIIVSQNPSPKPVISSTPKHQKSILSYVQIVSTPQKENDVNEINKNLLRSSSPAKQNVGNKFNTFVPIKENEDIEICESPVPQNNNPSFSYMEKNTFLNQSNTKNNSVSEKSKHKACIACSRLKRDEILAIINLTQRLGAKYNTDFDKNVTHLVVAVDDSNRIQDHTTKYVLAIAHSVWIVSSAWIQDSLQHNQLLPEEPYEVLDIRGTSGPKISRLTRLSNPLLKNFMICCVDPFASVNRIDIENAIIGLGGEIIKSIGDLTTREGKYCLIVVKAKETQDFNQYQVWRDKYNVLVVDVEWLSRTVGQYQITSVRPYLVCSETEINKLGYPFALIAPVPESQ